MILFLLDESSLVVLAMAIAEERAVLFPPIPDRSRQVFQDLDSAIPVDAGIGNANTLLKPTRSLGRDLLIALVNVGLNHDPDNRLLAFPQLVTNDLGDLWLVSVIFIRVA